MKPVRKALTLPGVAFASALLVLLSRRIVLPYFGLTIGTGGSSVRQGNAAHAILASV